MRFLKFDDFTTKFAGRVPYQSYTEGDIEICIEPLYVGFNIAIYIKEELVLPKKVVKFPEQDPITMLLTLGKEETEKIIKHVRFDILCAVNDLYKEVKQKDLTIQN